MGKRSSLPPRNAEHHTRDFWATPRKPVLPLIPHLHSVRVFAEPCCGEGDLIKHLESFGLRCGYRGDIATGQDAFARNDYGDIDAIITNPPWGHHRDRTPLHALIRHFQAIAPTWLLFQADWAHTLQAASYLEHCSDIVPVGRVKWIAGSKSNGMENAAWYRFDVRHRGGPVHHAPGAVPARTRRCGRCGRPYLLPRSDSRFCSNACRQSAYRQRVSVTQA
jgi:hypothetical protein